MAQPSQSANGGPSLAGPPLLQLAAATPFAVDINGGDIHITFAGATTCNFPVPQAGQDDGKTIEVYSETAFAHICSFGANKLNGNKTSYTWTKAVAGTVGRFRARNGVWWATGTVADAAAFAQQVTLA